MKRCPRMRPTRSRFSAARAVWCWGGLMALSVLFAGCQSKTTSEKSKSDSIAAKPSPAKNDKPKTTQPPVVKKTDQPAVKSKQPAKIAKQDPPKKEKKEDVELTPEEKAAIDAEIEKQKAKFARDQALEEFKKIGADVKLNNLEEVYHVSFDEPSLVKDRHFALLRLFPRLRYINATNAKISDAAIKHLENASEMSFLYLKGTNVADDSLKTIGKMQRLQSLCVDGTKITDAGLIYLKDLPEITKLHIRSRNKISDAGLSPLFKLKSLRELKIGGTQITASGLKELETFLPRCTVDTEPLK